MITPDQFTTYRGFRIEINNAIEVSRATLIADSSVSFEAEGEDHSHRIEHEINRWHADQLSEREDSMVEERAA